MGAIDADAHVIECEATFEHLDPEFRRFKPWITVQKSTDVAVANEFWVIDGRLQPMEGNVGSNTSKESREMGNIAARLAHMDELEIDVQVLYPTVFLRPWTQNPICEVAISRAYNRWMASIWKAAPDRLKWVVMPPLMSMDKVEEELRFGRDNGAVGVFLRGLECDRQFSHEYFFRLYELGQELDLPMCIHSGNGSFSSYGIYGGTSALGRGKLQVVASFHSLLLDNIPAKFPKLRWGFIEASAEWIPFALNDLGIRLRRRGKRLSPTIMKDNNMYVACLVTDSLDYILPFAGDSQLVVGTDYGHADNSAEIEALRKLKSDGKIPASAADKILTDNARALYGL
jgi:predicted TIM-barrel fold metal-dependent hydrolase